MNVADMDMTEENVRYAFRNRIASLYNIDKSVLDEALMAQGLDPLAQHDWMAFRDNPPKFFMATDKPTATAIWRCVEARQRNALALVDKP